MDSLSALVLVFALTVPMVALLPARRLAVSAQRQPSHLASANHIVAADTDSATITSVLGKLAGLEGNVKNIFADEPLAIERPAPMLVQTSDGSGRTITLDMTAWCGHSKNNPQVIRDFDSDSDRLFLVQPSQHDMPAIKLTKTRQGTTVLCTGKKLIAAFPGLKGEAEIDMILLDAD